LFCLNTSEYLYNAVLIACSINTMSIFFEANQCSNVWFERLFQLSIISVFLFDIALKIGYEGLSEYFSKDWQIVYATVTILMALDCVFHGCLYYTNPFRPVQGVLRARAGRRFFDLLKKMLPTMIHKMSPIFFFIVVLMVFSCLEFDDRIEEFKSTFYASYNWFFLVFTNDTFDRILPDKVFSHLSYLLVFFPSIYIGQRFLLSLIIGDTYDTFRQFVKKQVQSERLKEIKGLTKAFSAIDDLKDGVISYLTFKECLHQLYPGTSDEVIALYYELISGGSNTGISVLQFLNLRSVLSFKLSLITEKTALTPVNDAVMPLILLFNRLYAKIQFPLPRVVRKDFIPRAQEMMKYLDSANVLHFANELDIFLLVFSLLDYQLITFSNWLTITPCLLVSGFYLFEFLVRLVANDGYLHRIHPSDGLNLVDVLFIGGAAGRWFLFVLAFCYGLQEDSVLAVFCEQPWLQALHPTVLLYLSKASLGVVSIGGGVGATLSFRKLKLLCRGMRCMRIANLNDDLKILSSAMIDIMPAILETFTLTFVMTYIFGLLGHLLFGGVLQEWDTPLNSVIKAQQLTYMVNYLSSMEVAMELLNPLVVAVYFLVYLVISLAVSNIALSIIIDLHANVLDDKSSKEREGQRNKLQIVFDKIVEQARTRQVFTGSKSGHTLNFNHVRMSHYQSSNVRQFVAGGKNSGLQLEDIKACSKFSNINLVAFYKQEHRNMKDLNWEVAFLKAVESTKLFVRKDFKPDEVIIESDQPAQHIYLLTSGTVAVFRNQMRERAVLSPTNFFGYECLQPQGEYKVKVVCESDCSVMVFSQDDMAHRLDEELCGSIVRMSFKSHAQLSNSFSDFSKRRSSTMQQRSLSMSMSLSRSSSFNENTIR